MYIEGTYKLKGNIFFAPLNGHGAFHVNVSKYLKKLYVFLNIFSSQTSGF
nr:unnamed protein product [Callosobruchus chinensis]